MFENVDSAKPEKHWLLWATLKAIGLGIACFFPAFFLSLLITIPWSKHYWAGEGQLFAHSVRAQEGFSADVVQVKRPGTRVIAKVYFAQERMRIEPQNMIPRNAPPIAYIMYLNTQTQFMLLLRDRVYAKIPPQENWWMYTAFRAGDVENACSTWGKASHSQSDTCRKVGDDIVNGRTAVKYEGHCSQGARCFIWIDRRLRFLVKWENSSQGEELRNIQEGSQPIDMFEVPPGFKSVQATSGTIQSAPAH